MGMVAVRAPRQNRVPVGNSLFGARAAQDTDCAPPAFRQRHPLQQSAAGGRCDRQCRYAAATGNYAYNDGDGSTYYDVSIRSRSGFDPASTVVG
jgi:hypothetical protein